MAPAPAAKIALLETTLLAVSTFDCNVTVSEEELMEVWEGWLARRALGFLGWGGGDSLGALLEASNDDASFSLRC